MIALTFDDGPQNSERALIDVLNESGVKGTFFVNGNNWANIFEKSQILKYAHDSGHQIANHGWAHADMLFAASPKQEIDQLTSAVNSIIGRKPSHFRPPYGSYNTDTVKTLTDLNYSHLVMWTYDTNDWRSILNPGLNIMPDVYSTLNNADSSKDSFIFLLHEQPPKTRGWTEEIIEFGLMKGYRFVTTAECLGDRSGGYQ
jgi:peptidoglycan/xylan/chitin deacetylase (PgdA/CDA1 family)